jgi:hypothetical protein
MCSITQSSFRVLEIGRDRQNKGISVRTALANPDPKVFRRWNGIEIQHYSRIFCAIELFKMFGSLFCHHMHSADVIASNPEPLMVKSTKYECPLNPGQYAEYTLSDWKKGTLEDLVSFLADVDVRTLLKTHHSVIP